MIEIRVQGSLKKTSERLNKFLKIFNKSVFDKYGKMGVEALRSETPKDTGLTAESWYYEVEEVSDGWILKFLNSNIQNGVPIAVILQYGHGTGTGGWVEGRDYLSPALIPIFDDIASHIWREVKRS